MLPSELHFTVRTHSSVGPIIILCMSRFPRQIVSRDGANRGPWASILDCGTAAFFIGACVAMRHHPSESAEDRMDLGGQKGHFWSHGHHPWSIHGTPEWFPKLSGTMNTRGIVPGMYSHPNRGVITNTGSCSRCWCGGMRVGEDINTKQRSQVVSVWGWK